MTAKEGSMASEQVCKNCENRFTGRYCNQCGQSASVPRFTFRHILEEAFHALTHADKSVLGYIKDLVMNPGKLAYEYIVERKRKKYFNAFTFFLLITAVVAFVEALVLRSRTLLFIRIMSTGRFSTFTEKYYC